MMTREQADIAVAVLNRDLDSAHIYRAAFEVGEAGWRVVAQSKLLNDICEVISFENLPVGRHMGQVLFLDEENGFYSSSGGSCFGYCESLDDLKAEIDDYFAGDEHGPLNGYFVGAEA